MDLEKEVVLLKLDVCAHVSVCGGDTSCLLEASLRLFCYFDTYQMAVLKVPEGA